MKKTKITEVENINITDYIRTFLFELTQKENWKERKLQIRTLADAMRITGLLDCSQNTTFKSIADLRSGYPYWHEQKVDFIPSNLGKGKGFLFYFVCNNCERRVKYLYRQTFLLSPICRACCRLTYRQPNRARRSVSRLLNRDYLSSEAKYILIRTLKEKGITKEDIDDVYR